MSTSRIVTSTYRVLVECTRLKSFIPFWIPGLVFGYHSRTSTTKYAVQVNCRDGEGRNEHTCPACGRKLTILVFEPGNWHFIRRWILAMGILVCVLGVGGSLAALIATFGDPYVFWLVAAFSLMILALTCIPGRALILKALKEPICHCTELWYAHPARIEGRVTGVFDASASPPAAGVPRSTLRVDSPAQACWLRSAKRWLGNWRVWAAAVIVGLCVLLAAPMYGSWVEASAYRRSETTDSIAAYRSFVIEFPEGRHVPEARRRMGELAWRDARASGSVQRLQSFLHVHAGHARAGEAARLLETLMWEQACEVQEPSTYERFLKRFPHSRHAPQARQRAGDLAWAAAVAGGTAKSYREFLSQHPEHTKAKKADLWLRKQEAIDKFVSRNGPIERRSATDAAGGVREYLLYIDRFDLVRRKVPVAELLYGKSDFDDAYNVPGDRRLVNTYAGPNPDQVYLGHLRVTQTFGGRDFASAAIGNNTRQPLKHAWVEIDYYDGLSREKGQAPLATEKVDLLAGKPLQPHTVERREATIRRADGFGYDYELLRHE